MQGIVVELLQASVIVISRDIITTIELFVKSRSYEIDFAIMIP